MSVWMRVYPPPPSICCNRNVKGGNVFTTLTVRLTNSLSLAHNLFANLFISNSAVTMLLHILYNKLVNMYPQFCLKYGSVKCPVDIVGKQCHMTNSSWTSSQFEKGSLSVCQWSVFYYTLPKIVLTISQIAITPDRVTRFMCFSLWHNVTINYV